MSPNPAAVPSRAELQRDFGSLPLSFEQNRGQAAPGVDFIARGSGGGVLLGAEGARLMLSRPGGREEVLGLSLPRASPARPEALERLPGRVNYLRGGDPSGWRTDIPTFSRVRYPGVWPGVDLDWYGDGRRLEYDFRVAPATDPSTIRMRVSGARDLRVAANGDLVIKLAGGTVRQRAPVAYQLKDGRRLPVSASFSVEGRRIGFALGPHDPTQPLVIDPVLVYSTYLGGNSVDSSSGIAVDSAGAAYVIGQTFSTDFNTVDPIEGDSALDDVFVSKLMPAGNAVAYSTYLGGDDSDAGSGIAVDSAGAAYVTGKTDSTDFCTGAGCSIEGDSVGTTDAFVSKLTPAGNALAYSTYLGGDGSDSGSSIAVDSAGAAYVTGETDSSDFCTGAGCSIEGDSVGTTDAFVSKLTPAGSALAYSTYLGGDAGDLGSGIAVDSTGAAYVIGQTSSSDFCTGAGCSIEGPSGNFDAFISKLTPAGSGLAYSTYLGGGAADRGFGIAVDSAGAAYVTGQTESIDFNTVNPIEGNSAIDDVFVSKLTPTGTALAYSTYLGGDASDLGAAIAVDSAGAAYVTGQTISTDFNTVDPIEGDSAIADVFISKLTPAGSALAYSSYFGGDEIDSAFGIAVDAMGSAYVTGGTGSTDFDTLGQIEGDSAALDAFVFKLAAPLSPPSGPSPTGLSPTGLPRAAAGTCAGKPVTILGTDGKDVLTGTGQADVISGLGGADKIRGLGGGDRICGGKGGDRVNAGAGKDRVFGQGGSDTVSGGGGNDRVNGGKGNDRLSGGPGGRDRCAGGVGKRDRAAGSCERESGVP